MFLDVFVIIFKSCLEKGHSHNLILKLIPNQISINFVSVKSQLVISLMLKEEEEANKISTETLKPNLTPEINKLDKKKKYK